MITTPHSVRRQSLHVTVASEETALAVRTHLQDLNRGVLLPILERVLDEFANHGTSIYIDRIDVDLGDVAAADLERLLPQRFERELRQRIREALHRRTDEAGAAVVRSAQAARLEAVEQYLLTGTLPFGSSRGAFSLDEEVAHLLTSDPDAIVRLFRRRGANDRLLRRTALRLGEETLRGLLHALAPEDAAIVIVYMSEVRDYHAVEPLIPATGDTVSRTLWVVALTYVLRDPGTQFNRTTLLRSLLEGLAQAELWSYRDVLVIFDMALQQTGRRLPLGSSLLASVRVLVEAERRADPLFGAARLPPSPPSPASRAEARDIHPAATLPSRYDVADAAHAYVRTGMIPWTLLVRHPGFTIRHALNRLPELTLPMLRAIAEGLPREEQVRAWQRLASLAPGEVLSSLVRRLMEEASVSRQVDDPTNASVGRAPADRALFLARQIAALLHRHPRGLHIRAWPADGSDAHTFDPETDDPSRLRSLLARRAAGAVPASADEPASTPLLLALVQSDPAASRTWLTALARARVRASTLVDEAPTWASLQDAAHALLRPADAAVVAVVIDLLDALTPAELPGAANEVRRGILRSVLDRRQAGTEGRLLTTLLHQLFGGSLSQQVIEQVLTAARRLAGAGRITASALDTFTAELRVLGPEAEAANLLGHKQESARAHTAVDEDVAVLDWLRRLGSGQHVSIADAVSRDVRHHALGELIDRSPARVAEALDGQLSDPRARWTWVTTLGESDLARVFALLEPHRAPALLDAAELLFDAWARVTDGHSDSTGRRAFWAFLMAFLAGTREADRSVDRLTTFFLTHVAQQTDGDRGRDPAGSGIPERLRDAAVRTAGDAGNATLRAALVALPSTQRDGPPAPRAARGVTPAPVTRVETRGRPLEPRRSGERRRTAFSMDEDAAVGDPIYITNAGLVLTSPFLPRLYGSLDMLEPSPGGAARIGQTQISRAVHLLQWMVDGRTTAPEPLLCLNKVLCGVPIGTPVDPGIDLTHREIETATALLRSVIANWKMISNTSIAGLQETFLQREGRLERVAHGWKLQVQRRTVDVLMDALPWSVSTVVHSLMPEPIFVTW